MATARIAQEFADGTEFSVELHVDDDFPDACSEVRVQAMHMWRAAFGVEADT